MDRVENPMVIDSLWHKQEKHLFHEPERHYCCECDDDITDEGYEHDGEFLCKHCLLDRCCIHSWGEVS